MGEHIRERAYQHAAPLSESAGVISGVVATRPRPSGSVFSLTWQPADLVERHVATRAIGRYARRRFTTLECSRARKIHRMTQSNMTAPDA